MVAYVTSKFQLFLLGKIYELGGSGGGPHDETQGPGGRGGVRHVDSPDMRPSFIQDDPYAE